MFQVAGVLSRKPGISSIGAVTVLAVTGHTGGRFFFARHGVAGKYGAADQKERDHEEQVMREIRNSELLHVLDPESLFRGREVGGDVSHVLIA